MIRQTWRIAKKAIGANKMRTFLTMLGIIIGVTALNVLVSIADGASTSISGQISQIGANYLTVQISDDKEKPIRLSEFFELLDNAMKYSVPEGKIRVSLERKGKKIHLTVWNEAAGLQKGKIRAYSENGQSLTVAIIVES